MSKKESAPSFEEALTQLEKIVEKLESGELNLEDGISSFETGIELYRQCKSKLEVVEKRVSKLTAELKEEDL